MLKCGFGALLIIAGTFVVMNLHKEKTELTQANNRSMDMRVKIPASSETYTITGPLTPSKKIKQQQIIQNPSAIVFEQSADTVNEIIIPAADTTILYGNHLPVRDSLDLTNWPSAGSQRKRYSLSGNNTSGKTIACIRSVSKNINGLLHYCKAMCLINTLEKE